MTALVWFRNDLRVHDNPALYHACNNHSSVHAIFLVTPNQWRTHDMAPVREQFLHDNVQSLRISLAALGIPLLVKNAGDYSTSVAFIIDTAKLLGANALYFNQEYEINERQRDERVREQAVTVGLEVNTFHDQCLVPPGTLFTQQGAYFRVYTPFRKAAIKRLETIDLRPLPAPAKRAAPVTNEVFASWNRPLTSPIAFWPGSEQEGRYRLASFIEAGIYNYKEARDFPARDATSTLSPYLAVGAISPRQCLHACLMESHGALEPSHPGLQCWINELLWREFYRHITYGFPATCRHIAFQAETDLIPWRGASPLFDAWCEGRTGFPLVDAAMKQLLATGWMHNRLRMVTAMFLTKQLFTDWRLGEKFFMSHLIDGDFSANNGGWQWSASTGADAAPYFRVFNPTLQSQRFDAQGDFIRRWLPPLRSLSSVDIHSPSPFMAHKLGYPLPIVDHREATEHVKRQFNQLSAMKASQAST